MTKQFVTMGSSIHYDWKPVHTTKNSESNTNMYLYIQSKHDWCIFKIHTNATTHTLTLSGKRSCVHQLLRTNNSFNNRQNLHTIYIYYTRRVYLHSHQHWHITCAATDIQTTHTLAHHMQRIDDTKGRETTGYMPLIGVPPKRCMENCQPIVGSWPTMWCSSYTVSDTWLRSFGILFVGWSFSLWITFSFRIFFPF